MPKGAEAETSFVSIRGPNRKEKQMNFEILIAAIAALFVIGVAAKIAASWLHKVRHEFTVPDGFAGLLYHHGKFVAPPLEPGRHIRWGRKFEVAPYDLRKVTHPVAGQEVLTADNVSLKVSLLVTCQFADVVKAVRETQSWYADLYNVAQLALRAVAGAVPAEALLSQRVDIGAQLLARVQPEAAKAGLTVHTVEVKDVMLSAELKRAFADTLKAKQEGQAALERARGESASLRNLANAARVLDGNPALMNLRVLQSLASAQNAGNTLVLGVPGGLVPLKNGKPKDSAEPPVET